MRYLLFGDVHSTDLSKLERIIDESQDPIDTVICTGDFDSVKAILSYMKIKEKYEPTGIKFITVPGNHDDAVYYNRDINLSSFYSDVTIKDLHEKLFKSEKARDLMEETLGHTKKTLKLSKITSDISEHDAIIIHGALDGNMPEGFSKKNYSTELLTKEYMRDMWLRLYSDKQEPIGFVQDIEKSKENHERNFRKMEELKYRTMLRGHDHKPELAKKQHDNTSFFEPVIDRAYEFTESTLLTITPGAFQNGYYATISIEDHIRTVIYHQIEQTR
ncbi:MAG: metallophosphatase family protein [Nanoarchaeota archaeon]|nr:metallophosphatase family protein [Nanoarchaeota archaeon]